jgi:hypothetical protein
VPWATAILPRPLMATVGIPSASSASSGEATAAGRLPQGSPKRGPRDVPYRYHRAAGAARGAIGERTHLLGGSPCMPGSGPATTAGGVASAGSRQTTNSSGSREIVSFGGISMSSILTRCSGKRRYLGLPATESRRGRNPPSAEAHRLSPRLSVSATKSR